MFRRDIGPFLGDIGPSAFFILYFTPTNSTSLIFFSFSSFPPLLPPHFPLPSPYPALFLFSVFFYLQPILQKYCFSFIISSVFPSSYIPFCFTYNLLFFSILYNTWSFPFSSDTYSTDKTFHNHTTITNSNHIHETPPPSKDPRCRNTNFAPSPNIAPKHLHSHNIIQTHV